MTVGQSWVTFAICRKSSVCSVFTDKYLELDYISSERFCVLHV